MINVLVKDVMIPVSSYTTVRNCDTVIDLLQALESIRNSKSNHAHRDAIVVDDNREFAGIVTMLDIFRALEPNYKKVDERYPKGVLTQEFVMKMIKDFDLWLEPIQDVCARGAYKTVSDVMHVVEDADYINEEDSIQLALHKYVMGINQPLIVKGGDKVTGVLRFGDVFEVTRKAMLECPIS